MNKEKRQALEAAGFVFEDAEDFLELDCRGTSPRQPAGCCKPGGPCSAGSSKT